MTDQEVIETLAWKEGTNDRWVIVKRGLYYRPNAKGYTSNISEAWIVSEAVASTHEYHYDDCVIKQRVPLPPYLSSRDAIAPVLAGLTDEEWRTLSLNQFTRFRYSEPTFRQAISMSPSDLARAVAEVLKGGK